MIIIEIQTLIDITDSKVNRPNRSQLKEHDQFRNFSTLKQCVELRSNITYETAPVVDVKDLKNLEFGSAFKGKHSVWTFKFSPDRAGVYSDGLSEIGCLIEDIHGVPIIQNLTETVNIAKAIFDLKDPANKNTIIKAIQGTI
jgi:hypothetical protein